MAAMPEGPVDAADPTQLVASLATLSEREVEQLMDGPSGHTVLDEIFRQMRDTFRPDLAKGEDALVRFVVTSRKGTPGYTYELRIRDGVCSVGTEVTTMATKDSQVLTITMDRVRFIRVITGRANGPMLFLQRKIKIDGDLKFGGRIIGWFDIPQARKK